MDATQIIFILSAALVIASAVMVVTTRNLIHAALWLIATLFGVAVLYAVLEAGFLAVVQVVVYIGAIAIMFIFAVMLTRREMLDKSPQLNASWPMAALMSVVTLAGLVLLLLRWNGGTALPAEIAGGANATLTNLGVALTSPDAFVLPFEVASVLLLAALIGSAYVAMNKK